MLFSLVVALMVILIAAFWVYQGFFSTLIMFFETLIACMLAFGFYELLNSVWEESTPSGAGTGLPLAFMVIFLGSLMLMRVATDKLIKDTVSMPIPLDRAGAGIAGFFTGMIIIGSTLTAIQMLPISSAIFGFERYYTDKDGIAHKRNLGIFRPDEFVCGLASMLSNDRFGGDRRFSEDKPNYVTMLYSARAVPMSEENIFVKKGKVKVNAIWKVPQIDRPTHAIDNDTLTRSFTTESPDNPGNTYLVCNVSISKDASGATANDEVRFRVPQFRLVGPPPGGEGLRQPTRMFLASGMTDIYTHRKHGPVEVNSKQRNRLCSFGPTTDFILSPKQTNVITEGDFYRFDVAFEVPDDFKPWYLEFKHGGRVDLTAQKVLTEAPAYASVPQGQGGLQGVVKKETTSRVGAAPGGALHVANAIEERTEASNLLPLALDRDDPAVAKHISQGKIGGDDCHFWCEPKPYVLEPDGRVEEFLVPADKRMVQIGAEVLKQGNMYSRAIGYANRVLAQISINDDKGNQYFAVGFYAAVEIGGMWKIEIQYDPSSSVPERALKKPTTVTHQLMTKAGPDNTKFGFLFVVNPGVKIVSFNPGSGKAQTLDIDVPE